MLLNKRKISAHLIKLEGRNVLINESWVGISGLVIVENFLASLSPNPGYCFVLIDPR